MNGSTGGAVLPMDPDHIRRAMGDDNECTDCATLGHICRPCRAVRHGLRPEPTGWRAALVRALRA